MLRLGDRVPTFKAEPVIPDAGLSGSLFKNGKRNDLFFAFQDVMVSRKELCYEFYQFVGSITV